MNYDGDRPPVLSLMLCEKPTVSAERIIVGDFATISFTRAGALRVEEIAITDRTLAAGVARADIPRSRANWRAAICGCGSGEERQAA